MWGDPDKFLWIADFSKFIKNLPEPNAFCQFLADTTLKSFELSSVYLCSREKRYSHKVLGFFDENQEEASFDSLITLSSKYSTLPIDNYQQLNGDFYSGSPIQIRGRASNSLIDEKNMYAITLERLQLKIGYLLFSFNDSQATERFKQHLIFIDIIKNLSTAYLHGWLTNQKLERSQIHIKAVALTERQRALIKLFQTNKTVDQMAGLLGFSPSTIKKDLIEIYKFFGTLNRSEIHDMATMSGVLD